ncbi:hypothetical protein WME94_06235 [Sorangium sp. So ce429]
MGSKKRAMSRGERRRLVRRERAAWTRRSSSRAASSRWASWSASSVRNVGASDSVYTERNACIDGNNLDTWFLGLACRTNAL